MSKGPNGQNRPADTIGCAVRVAQIATGEVEDNVYVSQGRRKSGLAGAKARVDNTTKIERSETARKAALARWSKKGVPKMNSSPNERLNSLLFEDGRELVNIKFFPGTARGLTKRQLCDAAQKALRSALAKGPVNSPPVTGREKVKLEDF